MLRIPCSKRSPLVAMSRYWPSKPRDGWGWLLLILCLTAVRGALYAVLNPVFGSPDERDHFQYIAHLATNGASGSPGFEGHQPILYYLLMVPGYWITDGQPLLVQVTSIRLTSSVLLPGVVVFSWLAARRMAPGSPFVWVLATSMVALQPQNTFIAASINNDTAANLAAAVLTYLAVSLVGGGSLRWLLPASAAAGGTSVMTKGQVLPVAGVLLVVATMVIVKSSSLNVIRRASVGLAGAGLLIYALMGTSAGQDHLRVAGDVTRVLGDLRVAGLAAGESGLAPMPYVLTSYWAAFLGESLSPAHIWYGLPTAVVLIGIAGCIWRAAGRHDRGAKHHVNLLVLAAMVVVQATAVYLRYLAVYDHPTFPWKLQALQGRFFLTTLVPLALLVALGWDHIARGSARTLIAAGLVAALALFDTISLATLLSHYQFEPV